MLTSCPRLLDGRRLLCTNTYSATTYPLCTCIATLWLCLSPLMYISALRYALGTPSEFSSVPILVADRLTSSYLVKPDPRGIPYLESSKS